MKHNEETKPVSWLDEHRLQCGDVIILCATPFQIAELTKKCGPNGYDLMMLKEPKCVRSWLNRSQEWTANNILEIGIDRGGGLLFLDAAFNAQKTVGIDIDKQARLGRLTQLLLKSDDLARRITPYYETDQTDVAAVEKILTDEFGDEGIDLVIDDGSHLLDDTRNTFETVFPWVSKGGYYVIEDWSWGHIDAFGRLAPKRYHNQPSMSQIVLELTAIAAAHPDIIQKIAIVEDAIVITRGKADLPRPFRILDYGKSWASFDLDRLAQF